MIKKLRLVIFLCVFVFLTACKDENLQKSRSVDSNATIGSSQAAVDQNITSVVFPAYIEENPQSLPYIDEINNTQKFAVSAVLPKNWTISAELSDDKTTLPPGDFHTPVYIYQDDILIGYIGFNKFKPYTQQIDRQNYYKTVYPSLRLSSLFHWDPYTAVTTSDKAESGIADIWYLDPLEIDNHPGAMADVPYFETLGILSYNLDLEVFIGIAFVPGALDKEQATAIAETVSISAVK